MTLTPAAAVDEPGDVTDGSIDWAVNPDRTLMALHRPGAPGPTCWKLTPSGRVTAGDPVWTSAPGTGSDWRLLGWAAGHLLASWRREGGRSVLRIEDVTDPASGARFHRFVGRPVRCAVNGGRTDVLVALFRGGHTLPGIYLAAEDSYLLLGQAGVDRTGFWDVHARVIAAPGGDDGRHMELFDYDGRSLTARDVDWPDGVVPVFSTGDDAAAIGLTGLAADGRTVPGFLHGPSGTVRWFPKHVGHSCVEVAPSGGRILLVSWADERYSYRVVNTAGSLLAELRPEACLATDLRFAADEAHVLGLLQSPAQRPRLTTWDVRTGRTASMQGPAAAPAEPMRWAHRWFTDAGRPLPEWLFEPESEPGGRLGTVIHLHGGPRSRLNQVYDPVIATLVRHGWSVVGMNYPGSSGYGPDYREQTRGDWGGADVVAVVARIRALRAGSGGSPVFLYGHSYGGYLALLAAAAGESLDGVAVWAPVTDLRLLVASLGGVHGRWLEDELGARRSDAGWLRERSPIDRLSELAGVRLLVGHGVRDERCPVEQSRRLAAALSPRLRYLEDLTGSHLPSTWEWWADEVVSHYAAVRTGRVVAP